MPKIPILKMTKAMLNAIKNSKKGEVPKAMQPIMDKMMPGGYSSEYGDIAAPPKRKLVKPIPNAKVKPKSNKVQKA